ncbi:hypothetical protein IGL98_001057 [Enterococcus sp. DIV0840]|uniref:hypothetical protein n=1 Tax=unclassified Enterococcus TaxID=2608891 RepID=UPI0030CFBA6D
MKKFILSFVVVAFIGLTFSPMSVNAEEVGGWSEENGNYLNPNVILPRAAVNHRGKRESNVISGNTAYRAHGWTTWKGVYHYTTARMEKHRSGTVLTTSNRKYGWNGTEAASPWYRISYGEDTAAARTYYGR